MLLLGVLDAIERIYGSDISFDDSRCITILVCAGVLYALVFQWLGWRRFSRLQTRFALLGEAMPRTDSFARLKFNIDWLRCRPNGAVLNLVRKEIRLNRSAFLLAAVFSICWMLALGVFFILPHRRSTFEIIFNIMTAIYLPVLFLFAGCASLGEEKSLGLNIWQLTLPVAARRQWLFKLAVSGLIAVLLGLVLPWLLSSGNALKLDVGLHALLHGKDSGLEEVVLTGSILVFLVSFWASTMLTNTIAAALTTILAFPVLFSCVGIAAKCGDQWREEAEMLLYWLATRFHLSIGDFPNLNGRLDFYPVAGFLAAILLVQSFLQFRRTLDANIQVRMAFGNHHGGNFRARVLPRLVS